jgi:hypothetical protein
MAIVQFGSTTPGPQGLQGPQADRDINSMIMLAWLGSEPVVKSYDMYANNFSNTQGIDAASVALWNQSGFYSTPAAGNYQQTINFTSPSDVYRVNLQGPISYWIQDTGVTGHFETATLVLTSGVAVVDKGSNLVGLACTGQPYTTGTFVEVRGTTNYNGTYQVDATSSANEVVIPHAYAAEVLGGLATVNQRVTLGGGRDAPNVQPGVSVEFYDDVRTIMSTTGSGYRFGETSLDDYKETSRVTGIYDLALKDGALSPPAYYSTTSSGWTRVFNEGPQQRRYHTMTYDSDSKHIWMFGGYIFNGSARTNQLWKWSTVSGQWTMMSPPSSPSAREGVAMVYDPANQKLVAFGGYTGAAYLNELWSYSVVSGTWNQLTPTGGPPTIRGYMPGVYMPASGTMLVYGGYNGSTRPNELWEYKISTNTWRQITWAGTPSAGRSDHIAICQTVSGSMIIHGGFIAAETAETWKFNYGASNWTQLTSSTNTHRYHAGFYDSVGDNLYISTGYTTNTYSTIPTIWKYNMKTAWTQVSPAGGTPAWTRANIGYGAADSDRNEFYDFSGDNGNTNYNVSLWRYSPQTNVWSELYPPMRNYVSMVYAAQNNSLYILGGINHQGNQYGASDTWQYDCATAAFTKLYPTTSYGAATAARITSACYSPNLCAIFFWGGLEANSSKNDFWRYDIAANTWAACYPVGVYPSVRYQQAVAYDTDDDVFYIYGGSAVGYDFWRWDIKNNSILRLQPYGIIPSAIAPAALRTDAKMQYDPVNKCVWLFGGFFNGVYQNDLWRYDIATNSWAQIFYTGVTPVIRSAFGFDYDYATQTLWISWGTNATTDWWYRYDIRTNTMHRVIDSISTTTRNQLASAFNSRTGDIYVFGGNVASMNQSNEMLRYNVWDAVASGIAATTTSGVQLVTAGWNNITQIVPNGTTMPGSDLYYALSFDGRESYHTYLANTWADIVQNDAGTWQYLDGAGVWQNAATNDLNAALVSAFNVTANQALAFDTLQDLTGTDYVTTSGFVPGTLDIAIGFSSSNNYVANQTGFDIYYTASGTNMALITETWSASAVNPKYAFCVLDIEPTGAITLDTDLKAWVSMDAGVNYDQITGLSVLLVDGAHQIITGNNVDLTIRGSNQMKLKITTHNAKQVNLYAVGMAVRY